jgi:hypothetical protein
MKFSFIKREKVSESRLWFSSSRKSSLLSFESFLEKKSWNFFKRRQKTPNHPLIDSQATIIMEDHDSGDNNLPVVESQVVVEPVEILKSKTCKFKGINQDVPHIKEESHKNNLFTPRKNSYKKRSGKISPEFPIRGYRRGATTPTESSSSWNSLSLLRPPPPKTPPADCSIRVSKTRGLISSNGGTSVEQSVNSILEKLLLDPSLKPSLKFKTTCTSNKKIQLKSLKHLPHYIEEPLSPMSNVEVFEQDLSRRSTKRAWTVSSSDPRNKFSWMSLMSVSHTLNALSLPSLVIPSNLSLTHLRKSSEHHIELSYL